MIINDYKLQAIYADSPIDSSLFGLYIHQNYTQFCNDVNECEGIADWLSWVDSSGGEAVSIAHSLLVCLTLAHVWIYSGIQQTLIASIY